MKSSEPAGSIRKDQKIGEYCNGKDLAECRTMFGEALAKVCRTCPD